MITAGNMTTANAPASPAPARPGHPRTSAYTGSAPDAPVALIVLSLSTLTGYTKLASIKYVFTAKGYACGMKGFPLRKTAHGVVADAKKSGNK